MLLSTSADLSLEGDPGKHWLVVTRERVSVVDDGSQATVLQSVLVPEVDSFRAHSAIGSGRFVRRYRECLVEFFTSASPSKSGFDCAPGGPYASGADIRFPPYRPSMQVPSFAPESLARFVGRWEGDNEGGAYMIFVSTEMGERSITLLTGYSPYPQASVPTWVRELRFTIEKDGVSIRFDAGSRGSMVLKRVADDELLLLWQASNLTSPFRMVLKKRPLDR